MKQQLLIKIEKIMKSDVDKSRFFSFQFLLLVCSKLYFIGLKIRNLLYMLNFIKQNRLPCFVISVGNITVGGTGKTPMTIYIANVLKKLGFKPAIVTRGYKGNYKDASSIVSDGSNFFLNVQEAGDEAVMMADDLKIPVVVGKSRYQAGKLAIARFNPDVIILDDAFQHIALKRDLDLLLCDSSRPLGNFQLIPRGQLREPAYEIQRCDAVILTRSDKTQKPDFKKYNGMKSNLFKSKQLFHCFHSPSILNFINCESSFDHNNLNITGFLFSGIADNSDFKSTCLGMGVIVKGVSEFPDHHWYTKKELKEIYENYIESGADYLVTTQKDYIKIKELISDFPLSISLVVIGIEIRFKTEHGDKFANLIKTSFNTYLNRKE